MRQERRSRGPIATAGRRSIHALAALGCAVVALAVSGGAAGAQSRSDFDGDGFADLAVGIPRDDAGAVASAAP